jgi:competence protein ComEA
MEKLSLLLGAVLILALTLTAVPAFAAERQVNINEADANQLALLPRVGPALAGRIIEFRDENGKFKQPQDIMLVRGIGEKTFELMKPFLAVSGETTLTQKLRVSELEIRQEAEAKDEEKDGE